MQEKTYSVYSIKLKLLDSTLYVGRTVNFKNRVIEHRSRAFGNRASSEWQPVHRFLRTHCFCENDIEFSVLYTGLSDLDSEVVEIYTIGKIQPVFNVYHGNYPISRTGRKPRSESPLKGRKVPGQGEMHHAAQLNEANVKDIFIRAHSGENQQSIADDYEIDRSQVSHIKRGKSWSHVTRKLQAINYPDVISEY